MHLQIEDGIIADHTTAIQGWNTSSDDLCAYRMKCAGLYFATLVDSGKLNGTLIFRIQDSMRDVFPKKWLIDKVLLEYLNFQTLRSEKIAKNIALRTFA